MTSTASEKWLESLKEKKKKRILFVCLGNICRSPAAEGIMRETVRRHGDEGNWTIDSAGTGDWHVGDLPDSRMRAAAAKSGYRLTHRCRQLRASDFDDFDLIIGMDEQNMRNIRLFSPSREEWKRVQPISLWLSDDEGTYVPDPYYGTEHDFDRVVSLLESACSRLYDTLSE